MRRKDLFIKCTILTLVVLFAIGFGVIVHLTFKSKMDKVEGLYNECLEYEPRYKCHKMFFGG